jgi:8-oxo-dGTP diphosphatase
VKPCYIVNVEGAIFQGDRWLVIRRSLREEHAPGTLSLVGGKVEDALPGSDILELTLRREIREEVGLEVAELHYLESKLFLTAAGEPVVDVVYVTECRPGGRIRLDPDEVAEVRWLTAREVAELAEAPPYLQATLAKAEPVRIQNAG